ncbi:integrase domain-containing protein [Chromohalobacter sp. 296-RDG]|uniref:integrase domain-containing protein n=1 Tax=Chromohalobacter sp. 296-RDG TaxID=2994062 RepID=UPI002469C5ED|nr:integrase domain-containing protein [Chromohalobacter sp. 296-RDG]
MAKGTNFGLKTRDLAKAGRFAVNEMARAGTMAYASAATLGQRWQAFAAYAKEAGVKRLEGITGQLVASYAQSIAARVAGGELSAAYGQNLVSAVNSVMTLATQGAWESVSPTKDGGIAARVNVRTEIPDGLDRAGVTAAAEALRSQKNANGATVVELARDFGLRAKEASLLDARQVLQEASERGRVTISAGTKGGRTREVPITHPRQLETLAKAAAVQEQARSLIPANQTWAQWEETSLRQTRETLQEHSISRIHELRAAYAVERYQAETGHLPRMMNGKASRTEDRAARLVVARELGHSRIAITVSYLGTMR